MSADREVMVEAAVKGFEAALRNGLTALAAGEPVEVMIEAVRHGLAQVQTARTLAVTAAAAWAVEIFTAPIAQPADVADLLKKALKGGAE